MSSPIYRIVLSVGALLILLSTQPSHAAAPEKRMDHISIKEVGRGSPVILIPGMSTPRAVWDDFAPDLAKRHRVVLVQINGFGGDDPGANLKPGLLAGVLADLHRYVVENKLAGAAVVGHSLGGGLGLILAKEHPADVGKLMMIEAQPYVGDKIVPGGDTVEKVEPYARAMRDEQIASFGKPVDTAAVKALAAESALTPAARAKLDAWTAAADPRVSGEAIYEGLTADQRPYMKAIATPITVVYAWSDSLPKEKADAQFRADFAEAPHVTHVPIGGSAHFLMLDQPAAFAEALNAFLDGRE